MKIIGEPLILVNFIAIIAAIQFSVLYTFLAFKLNDDDAQALSKKKTKHTEMSAQRTNCNHFRKKYFFHPMELYGMVVCKRFVVCTLYTYNTTRSHNRKVFFCVLMYFM